MLPFFKGSVISSDFNASKTKKMFAASSKCVKLVKYKLILTDLGEFDHKASVY